MTDFRKRRTARFWRRYAHCPRCEVPRAWACRSLAPEHADKYVAVYNPHPGRAIRPEFYADTADLAGGGAHEDPKPVAPLPSTANPLEGTRDEHQ